MMKGLFHFMVISLDWSSWIENKDRGLSSRSLGGPLALAEGRSEYVQPLLPLLLCLLNKFERSEYAAPSRDAAVRPI